LAGMFAKIWNVWPAIERTQNSYAFESAGFPFFPWEPNSVKKDLKYGEEPHRDSLGVHCLLCCGVCSCFVLYEERSVVEQAFCREPRALSSHFSHTVTDQQFEVFRAWRQIQLWRMVCLNSDFPCYQKPFNEFQAFLWDSWGCVYLCPRHSALGSRTGRVRLCRTIWTHRSAGGGGTVKLTSLLLHSALASLVFPVLSPSLSSSGVLHVLLP